MLTGALNTRCVGGRDGGRAPPRLRLPLFSPPPSPPTPRPAYGYSPTGSPYQASPAPVSSSSSHYGGSEQAMGTRGGDGVELSLDERA